MAEQAWSATLGALPAPLQTTGAPGSGIERSLSGMSDTVDARRAAASARRDPGAPRHDGIRCARVGARHHEGVVGVNPHSRSSIMHPAAEILHNR